MGDDSADRGSAGLANRAHQHGLAPFDVGNLQRVAALGRNRPPRAVARLQPLSVLRKLHVLDERQTR